MKAKNSKINEVLSSQIDAIKQGLSAVADQSSHMSTVMDFKSKQAVVHCVYALAKIKQSLNIQDGGNVDKILTSVRSSNSVWLK